MSNICKLFFVIFVTMNSLFSFSHSNEPDPCTIVIFGATGDLTSRKLIPALYNLTHEGNISKNTTIVGFARRDYTNEIFREKIKAVLTQFSKIESKDNNSWNEFQNKLFYNQAGFDEDIGYKNLQKLLLQIDQDQNSKSNRIYYLATHPSHFSTIIQKLHENDLIYDSKGKYWSRVIIEKPFGSDLNSAIQLQEEISKHLHEDQIYRMDHYLGKEGVQNLLSLRFESAFFEPLWNNKYIDNIQITLSEDLGIGSRANFWEETGSLRDVFQNHLMQLLATVAMEEPTQLDSNYIHKEKIKVLNAIRPFPLTEIDDYVVRGQYDLGKINGKDVVGYKQEEGVNANSTAETFIAAKILIDNDRWKGVPFYVRGGKRLQSQTTEIAITFKDPKSNLKKQPSNILFIRIQPNAGVFLQTASKLPMLDKQINPIVFGFSPDTYFNTTSPEAYEKLFYDCIQGDKSLYVDAEEQVAAWRLLTPVLDYWKLNPNTKMNMYKSGTWGPESANQLPEKNGHAWHILQNKI